jgi:N-acetylglutamate synthase-like GNAT family acetyltransferase
MRGHGFAKGVVAGLVEACGKNTLYMHSVLHLVDFYRQFGFIPIGENDLPPTIRDRYAWAGGELEGADVCPMRRDAS